MHKYKLAYTHTQISMENDICYSRSKLDVLIMSFDFSTHFVHCVFDTVYINSDNYQSIY